eukprot:8329079-Pyramimonas_sp.AAC.1
MQEPLASAAQQCQISIPTSETELSVSGCCLICPEPAFSNALGKSAFRSIMSGISVHDWGSLGGRASARPWMTQM